MFKQNEIVIISNSNMIATLLSIWIGEDIQNTNIINYSPKDLIGNKIKISKKAIVIYDCNEDCDEIKQNIEIYKSMLDNESIRLVILNSMMKYELLSIIKKLKSFKYLLFKPFMKSLFIDKIKNLMKNN